MRRLTGSVGVVVALLAGAGAGGARQAAEPAQVTPGYAFPTGAGMLFFHVRPDRLVEFEAVVARIDQTLKESQDPVRRQQAPGWRIYRSAEATPDAALYVFVFDPAIDGADYDPVKLLGEAAPADAQALYERLKGALVRVERMGLAKIR